MSENDSGGVKEATFAIKGDGAFSIFKWEGGTHRVQRVPETESQGRIHTSTATVAVMPEAEEIDVQIDENDLKIDVYRSTGPGGQSVNTTDSAVRITHLPTGHGRLDAGREVAAPEPRRRRCASSARGCSSRSWRSSAPSRTPQRRSQVGSGERAEKIRTYNFPENRVTDHRVHVTVHALEKVLGGELDEFTEALAAEDRRRALEDRRGVTARDALREGAARLEAAGVPSPRVDAEFLLAHVLGTTRSGLALVDEVGPRGASTGR